MKKLSLLLLSLLFAFTAFANDTRNCQAPTNIVVTVEEDVPDYSYKYKVTVSWDAVEGAEGYNIYCLDGTYLLGTTNACFYYAGTNNEGSLDFRVATICYSGETSELSEPVIAVIGESSQVEEYETKFNLYPNPVNDRLFIETTEDIKEVIIYNIVGVPVYQGSNITNSIEVSNFSEGIYFVRITTDKGEATKKFIKK